MKNVLILGAAALVTLAACGGASKTATPTQAPTTQAPVTAPAPTTTTMPKATGGDITACGAISNAYATAGLGSRGQQWVTAGAEPGKIHINVSAAAFWNVQKPAYEGVSAAAATVNDPTLATDVAKLTSILRDDLEKQYDADPDVGFPTAVWTWMKNADAAMASVDQRCSALGVQQTSFTMVDPKVLKG